MFDVQFGRLGCVMGGMMRTPVCQVCVMSGR
jgi:hypothetical protein